MLYFGRYGDLLYSANYSKSVYCICFEFDFISLLNETIFCFIHKEIFGGLKKKIFLERVFII